MTSDEIRRTYLEFFEAARPPAPALGFAGPGRARPLGAVHRRGHAPAQALLPRAASAPPHPRVTTCQKTFRTVDIDIIGTTTPAPHVLRDARATSRSATTSSARRSRFAWELSTDGFGFAAERHLDHGVRGRRGARARARRGGDRGVAGDRRAARADRRVPALGELLAGRADRARAARARSCTSTAASSSASPTTCPAATTSASSSTGTSCSCSSTRTRSNVADAAAGARTSTPASGSTAWRRSCRASRRCSRPTSSRR